ncbi:outer membrane-specific lipoprotein transporter subunit LolC [compost metagenome]
MNTLQIVWKNISKQTGSTILSILLTAFGVAILCVLSITSESFEKQLENNSKNIDLVIGAKGSPLQLILSSVYHIDNPTGNIPLAEAEKLQNNPLIKLAVPVSLGDNYRGHRIVGTDSSFLTLYETKVQQGKLFQKNYEVVIGTDVANKQNLKIGDHIHSSHGLSKGGHSHDDHPFTVVGILAHNNNITDNLILTSLSSVWDVHGIAHDEHHEELTTEELQAKEDLAETRDAYLHHHGEATDEEHDHTHEEDQSTDSDRIVKSIGADMIHSSGLEITALLVQYQSPAAIAVLPKFIAQNTQMQAASPAIESARLFSLLGVGIDSLQILAYIIMAIAGLSVFISLYNALKQRKYDLAIMRTLGASKLKLFTLVIFEGMVITVIGGFLGLIFAHIALYYISLQTSQSADFIHAFKLNPVELIFVLLACIIGIISALIPAIKAYKTTISHILSGN